MVYGKGILGKKFNAWSSWVRLNKFVIKVPNTSFNINCVLMYN